MIGVDVEARLDDFHLQAKFDAPEGITALFGPSGSGKTSLVRMIAGLEEPSKGTISIADRVLFDAARNINLAPRRRKVGYVFQDVKLFPHFNVRRNLTYSAWAGGRSGGLEIDNVCEVLGIAHLLTRKPATLSGGEKQRVAIGRALLSDPSVLLLDEPLSALDAGRKLEIMPFLEKVRDEFHIPIVYISHSIEEVKRLAQYLVVLDGGKVTAQGPIDEVLAGIDVGTGLEGGNVLEGVAMNFDAQSGLAEIEVEGQALFLPVGEMEAGQLVRLQIRADDIALALTRPDDTSIENMLECVISSLEPAGPTHMDIGLEIGIQNMRSRITRNSAEHMKLAEGQKCVALLRGLRLQK